MGSEKMNLCSDCEYFCKDEIEEGFSDNDYGYCKRTGDSVMPPELMYLCEGINWEKKDDK
jgi:hypothetical protein